MNSSLLCIFSILQTALCLCSFTYTRNSNFDYEIYSSSADTTVPKQVPNPAKSTSLKVPSPMIMPGTRLDTNFNSLPAPNPDVAKAAPNWLKNQATGNPLYVIDGKMATASELRKLQPNQVASVNRLASSRAVALYGKNARNGLVLIITKAGLAPKN